MVYLLHFDPPFKQARHYLGYTQNFERRRSEHEQGRGAALVKAALRAGSRVILVRTWEGTEHDRHFERRLKRGKNSPKLCHICNPRLRE